MTEKPASMPGPHAPEPGNSLPLDAREMCRALYRHFTPRWAVLTEVTTTDEAAKNEVINALGTLTPADEARARGRLVYDRRIDVLLLGSGERMAVEVKVSRADFLSDIKNPAKQAPWREIADRHAYATPKGLVTLDEVPADSGLIEVERAGAGYWHVGFTRRAPRNEAPKPLPDRVRWGIIMRCAYAEAKVKGLAWGSDEDDPAELRAQVERLTRDLETERKRTWRAQERLAIYRKVAALTDPPPCAACGFPLRPDFRRSARYEAEWKHLTDTAARACLAVREATALERRDGGDRYARTEPPWPTWPEDNCEIVAGEAS